MSFIGLQKRELNEDSPISADLDSLYNRVRSMGLIHKLLYSEPNLSELNAQKYLTELISAIVEDLKPPTLTLETNKDIEPLNLNIDQLIPCGLILNELLSNALKHAFQGKDNGKISIRLKQRNDEKIVLTVNDNGSGPPNETIDTDSSLGWRIINSLTNQINADIVTSTANGFKVQVIFTP
jgi:two-component sensor histidine kinase